MLHAHTSACSDMYSIMYYWCMPTLTYLSEAQYVSAMEVCILISDTDIDRWWDHVNGTKIVPTEADGKIVYAIVRNKSRVRASIQWLLQKLTLKLLQRLHFLFKLLALPLFAL